MDRVLGEITTTMPTVPDRLPPPVQEELAEALRSLRRGRGLVVRLADLMGMAVGSAGGLAMRAMIRGMGAGSGTGRVPEKIRGLAEAALARAFDIAILGLPEGVRLSPGPRATQAVVTLSGAIGGFYGMAGLVPDATFTTLAIMREIARLARDEGEDLTSEAGRQACLEVFLLSPDARLREATGESDLSYFSARLVLQGRPVLALLNQAGARYGLVLSDKLALQAVPVLGALCGAAVNHAFLAHYRDLARAHFTLRRLERAYGETRVRAAALAAEAAAGQPVS
jgi:hypothetical protein